MIDLPRARPSVCSAPLLSFFALAFAALTGCAGAPAQPACPEAPGGFQLSPKTLDHPSTPATQEQAVNELFDAMHMQQQLDVALANGLKIQMEANPKIRRFESVMRKFMAKYLSLEGIREPLAHLYVSRFSELEIRQLTAFYRTPLGERTLAELPRLLEEGGQIGAKKVKDHMPELMKLLQDEMEKDRRNGVPID